jgi:hypothetical protein
MCAVSPICYGFRLSYIFLTVLNETNKPLREIGVLDRFELGTSRMLVRVIMEGCLGTSNHHLCP